MTPPTHATQRHRPAHLIDVSRNQRPGDIDWRQIRDAGVIGAYIRASAGSLTRDDAAQEHAKGAQAVGLLVGYYHAVSPDRAEGDAEREARLFLDCCADLPRPTLVHAVDVERGKGELDLAAWVRDWVWWWRAIRGRGVLALYTTPSYLRHLERGGYQHDGPLWLAHWRLDNPKTPMYSLRDVQGSPPPARDADLWQWTSSGDLVGYEGRLDLDYAPRGVAPLLRRADR